MKCPQFSLLLLALMANVLATEVLPLPARASDAPSGSALLERLKSAPIAEREEILVEEVLAGNVPPFLRTLCPIALRQTIGDKEVSATAFVIPDYLAVGSDEDYLLAPLRPAAAQQIADRLDCVLPTPKLVDAAYTSAPLKLPPTPLEPGPAMTTMAVMGEHSRIVSKQRQEALATRALGTLTAGDKKDVVLTPRLRDHPGKVAIYGWHRPDASPIQPLYTGHTENWVDYSHGIRLVSQKVLVDGEPRRAADLLADPQLSVLLSGEGTIAESRYVTIAAEPLRGLKAEPAFHELADTFSISPSVRARLVASDQFKAGKPVHVVFYACPNGNTLEETLGHAVPPESKSKFGIQQIAAQTRFLRDVTKDENLVLVCVEARGLSWPAWRKKNGDTAVVRVVNKVLQRFVGAPVRVTLSGHSGGGSFIIGFLNAFDQIPDYVDRIAFLDANYGYETEKHAAKLANWLESSRKHRLVVLSYRDDLALWEGKPFVTSSGGTAGRSKVMLRDLDNRFIFTRGRDGDIVVAKGIGGRAQFYMHDNPAHIILHTVQVERNGFIHSMLAGTGRANRGYKYMGDPAYRQWISPE